MAKHPRLRNSRLTGHPSRGQLTSTRTEHKRVLAVFTGEVTESEILTSLKQELPNGVLNNKYAKNIDDAIQYATREAERAINEHDDYDRVFIVADVDNLMPGQLNALRDEIEHLSCSANLILSKPCIEVWLSCYSGHVSGDSYSISGAQKEAHDKGFTYGKGNKHVHTEKLRNHQAAIKEAKRLRRQYCSEDDITIAGPATDFYKILEFLQDELDG